jgi:hypothetical protein
MKLTIDVADLVIWTYQDQRADLILDSGIGLFYQEKVADGLDPITVSGDGCYQVATSAILGTRIDSGGFVSGQVAPDAEAVHLAVQALGRPCVGILIEFGRSGLIPDWMPGAKPKICAKLRPNGKPVYVYLDALNKRQPIACLVEEVMSQEIIDFRRFVYAKWHDALCRLAVALEATPLVRWRVAGPQARPTPWLEQASGNQPHRFPLDSSGKMFDKGYECSKSVQERQARYA